MRASDILTSEHRIILRTLDIFDSYLNNLHLGNDTIIEKTIDLIDFIKFYAVKIHHGKEEALFFPKAEIASIKNGGDIEIKRVFEDHEEGKYILKEIFKILNDKQKNIDLLIETSRNYISLLKPHIDNEDNVLFKLADKFLTKEDNDELLIEFKKHDDLIISQQNYDIDKLLSNFEEFIIEINQKRQLKNISVLEEYRR